MVISQSTCSRPNAYVKKGIDFENFFSLITSDTIKEVKYRGKEVIPFEDSAKLLFTSNYLLKGQGHSHDRRRIEVFISNFFSEEFSILKTFKHRLFDDWSKMEYNRFYNTMIKATQLYLANGIIENNYGREYFLLLNSSPEGFLDACDELLKTGEKMLVNNVHQLLKERVPELKAHARKSITILIMKYCNYKQWSYTKGHSGSSDNFILERKDKVSAK